MSKLHKNAILTGCIDCYCLVCETHLRSEEDAHNHIGKPIHKKNLESTEYLENYKDDHIRKVKKSYFCEFCNLLFSMVAKAILHITDAQHMANRSTHLLKRVGPAVILANDIFINEKAWNGIIDNTCTICNTEFFNEHIHKTEQKHILNLVQKEVVFRADGIIYRKIDDSSFQCLICNMIFAITAVTSHFFEDDHMKSLIKCREFQQPPISPVVDNTNEVKQTIAAVKAIPEAKIATGNKVEVNNKNNTQSKNSGAKSKNDNLKQNKQMEKSEITNTNINYVTQPCGCVTMKVKPNKTETRDKILFDDKPKVQIKNQVSESSQNTSKSPKINSAAPSNNSAETPRKKLFPKKVTKNEQQEDGVTEKHVLDIQKILDNISDYQKKGININFETRSVNCKKCFANLDLDSEAIEKHIEDHKNNPNNISVPSTSVDPNFSKTVLKNDNRKLDNVPNKEDQSSNKTDENHNITKVDTLKPNKVLLDKENTDKENTITNDNDATQNNDQLNKALVKYLPTNDNKTTNETKTLADDKNKGSNIFEDDALSYAKANKLTYNKGNSNAFCRLCSSRIPSSLRSMKEHVAGAAHSKRVSQVVNQKPTIPKRPMEKFIKTKTQIANLDVDDVVINDKYCLTSLSFLMITEHGNRLRCQVCEVNIRQCDLLSHVETSRHELALDETPVMWCLDSEFIREVRPSLYHCGFCNLIAGCWDDVKKHLACEEHSRHRSDAGVRLRDHMPDIEEHRRFQTRKFLNMFMLGQYGSFF